MIFCIVSLWSLVFSLGFCLDKSPSIVSNCAIFRFKSSIIFSSEFFNFFLAILTVVKVGDLKNVKSFPLTLISKSFLSSVDGCGKKSVLQN